MRFEVVVSENAGPYAPVATSEVNNGDSDKTKALKSGTAYYGELTAFNEEAGQKLKLPSGIASFTTGGDPLLVSPGPDGEVCESIRFKVFADAMNDLRAMELLLSC